MEALPPQALGDAFLGAGYGAHRATRGEGFIARYSRTAPEYREWYDRVAAGGYEGLAFE